MRLVSYIHPTRTYLPCTGVGRHMNQVLLGLASQTDINLELLFSKQWLGVDGKLDSSCLLRDLSYQNFPMPENILERTWKLFGLPCMDVYIPDGTDWLYAPMETYIPVSKCPVAVTLHDIQAFESNLPWSHTWQHRLFRYKWGQWVRRALSEYRVIFTVSEFSKKRMVELLGANSRKLVVVGNGVDPAFFDIASVAPSTLKPPIELPYILVIGGLRYKKGGDHILSVARSLERSKSNLQILIAGELEAEYIEAAKDLPNLKLLGMVSDEILPQLVRSASSLLFLSLYEGFGIPALEAMAAGIPAIVSNSASLPEVVGDAGIIVDPENADHIADILTNLEADSRLRHDYSCRGQKHAAQYTWSRCVNRVVTALNQFA
jgi:glycosyltransferase involved in cell wall biosynthesis